MAACNLSIIDYGTYGVWGAILSGGDIFFYNLTNSYDAAFEMASLLPNWHIVMYCSSTSILICVVRSFSYVL